jgi:hypothetical protein
MVINYSQVTTVCFYIGVRIPSLAMPAVAQLLVGSPKPDRSKGRSQTKRDTLALQVGGWAQGQQARPGKNLIPLKMLNY